MIWIYRYIIGNLKVLFYGEFSEKILNLTVRNGINIWNSQLVKNGIESNISIKDFRRLRKIIRKSGIKVHILGKYGLPFKIKKNREHLGIAFGFIFLVIFLNFFSSCIWIIDVKGNEKIENDYIIKNCEELNIKIGTRKSKINSKVQREQLLLKTKGLAWASLNIEGCKLTVNVSEIKNNALENSPCNLKASADGIIKKIDIKSGNCLVKTGDVVKKGDVLVSGILEKLDSTEFVSSKGTVTAIVKEVIKLDANYINEIKTENGKVKTKSVLEFFGFKIPLFLGKEKGEYNSSLTKNNLELFGSKLPIAIYKKEFRFISKQKITYSKDKLVSKLENDLINKIESGNPIEYKIEEKEITENEDGISISAVVLSERDITYMEEVKFAQENV